MITKAINIEEIKTVKRKYGDFLRSLPHVKFLGIGPKVRGGRTTGEMSVKVYVDEKLDKEELAKEDRVPPDLEGIPTDVEVADKFKAR